MPPTSKTIAIHQPNYLPWLGFFYKIYASDAFVFHDNVAYSKRSLTKRCQIRQAKRSMEKTYLIVPLQSHSDGTLIKDLKIDHQQAWIKKQLNQIRNTYTGAPCYNEIFPWLERHLNQSKKIDFLADLNIYFTSKILALLEIDRPVYRSSELPFTGYKSGYNLQIVEQLKGSIYLSGTGAKKYQTKQAFLDWGIQLKYHNFLEFHKRQAYPQAQGAYLYGLSIIDSLFNLGPTGTIQLFQSFEQSESL